MIDVISYEREIPSDHLLGLAVAAETRLRHPVAEALRARARDYGVPVPICDATDYHIGLGVQGQVNGYYLHVGSQRFMQNSQIRVQRASRDAVGLIKQNYGIVAALNTLALALALPGGLVTPGVTAVLSDGSAILASVNGVRPMLRGT